MTTYAKHMKTLRLNRIARLQCTRCGKQKEQDGYTQCTECRDYISEYKAKQGEGYVGKN